MAKKPVSPQAPEPQPLPPELVEEPAAAATPQEAEVVGLWARNVTPLLPAFPSRQRIADIGFLLDVVLRLIFAGLFAYLAYWWLNRVGGIVERQTDDKKLSDAVLVALLGTTTVNVLGLLYFVAGYLFPKLKPEGPPEPPKPPQP
jgi:hypothetical protein